MVKWNEIVHQQQMNKTEKYKKRRTDTIKKWRAAVNKKNCRTKIKRSYNTTKTFHFLKPVVPKTPKYRPIFKIRKDALKMRLIINTQNSRISKIAKKISKELRP